MLSSGVYIPTYTKGGFWELFSSLLIAKTFRMSSKVLLFPLRDYRILIMNLFFEDVYILP